MKKILISILLCADILSGETLVSSLEVDVEWFERATFRTPYRMKDLDGAKIAALSQKPTAVPLLFPKLVSPFDWIDRGLMDFISLDQLCENPHLRPPIEQYKASSHSPFYAKKDVWKESVSGQKIGAKTGKFDIGRLIVAGSKGLPDDQQLSTFLNQDKVELTAEEKERILEKLFSGEDKKDFIAKLLKPDLLDAAKVSKTPAENRNSSKTSVVELTVPRIEIPEAPLFSNADQPEKAYSGEAILKFKASKSTANGEELPAQASDFYVTTKALNELFGNLDLRDALVGEAKTVAELWAKAEKSSDPEVIFGMKSILLEAKVGKTRTNAFGQASLEGIEPSDKYYLIGIEKDDLSNQVTIWSKEVQVSPGENMVELSSNDVIYQE